MLVRSQVKSTAVLFACCLLVALFTAASVEAAPPLIAQWSLDGSHVDGANDVTDDASGNGLALTSAAGTMHFGTELGKFAGYLAGASTTNLQVDSPLLAPQRLTLLAWIKQNGNPGTLRYIAGRGDDGPTCGGSSYALYTGYPGNGGLHFYLRQPDPGAPSVLSDPAADSAVFDGNWHLIAGTYDGANMRFFVDGVPVGAPKPATGIGYGPPMVHSASYVDGYPPQAACLGASDFPGQIDEVRVYERALSQTELGRLAAAPGPTPPELIPDATGPPAPGPGPRLTLTGPGPASSSRFSILKFDANAAVKETLVKIDNNPAFHLSPSNPYVGVSLGRSGNHFITGTAIGFGGGSVTQTTNFTTSPSGPAGGSLSRPKFMPDTAVSSSTAALLLETLRAKECVPDSVVYFGVVEAEGCFRKIDPYTELPPNEKSVAEEYVGVNSVLEHAGPRPCRLEDRTCHVDYSTTFNNPAIKPFVAYGPVHVNGMTIKPASSSASIVVFPAIKRLISSNAVISYDGSALGSIPVQKGPLNIDFGTKTLIFQSGKEELNLFSFDTSQAFDDIGGFPINGKVDVIFKKVDDVYSTALKVNLSLPDEISTAAGANPTARVEVNATNQRGTYLGELNIHLGEAFLGPVELANVDFTYLDGGDAEEDCPSKWWKATAEVFFVPVETGQQGAGLKMAPEPRRNGVAFCAGDFHSAGATLRFGYPFLPPPEILPGVTLNEIGFSFQLHQPVVFDGHAVIKSAEIITATGGFLAAFASPGHPYTFRAGDAGGSMASLAGQTYASTTMAVGGKVEIEPSDDVSLELGSAAVLYSYPNYIYASGAAHLQTYLFVINAGAGFELNTSTRRFNGVVHGEICLLGGIKVAHVGLCAGGEGHVSSRGVSVCFDLLDGEWTPGVGYRYGDTVPTFFAGALGDGCKPSEFWEVNVRGARISAAPNAPLVFRVKPGEKAKTVQLTGSGGAPAVTVVAPGGEQLASESNTMLHGKRLSAISGEKFSRTWIGVENAKPGVYKVIPQPGSPQIVDVQETRYEPDAGVKASVTGSGRHQVLHYDAGHAKGQSVSFYERGKGTWDLLKTVKGGKGTVSFVPTFGPGGTRSIAAQVEVGGIPGPLETLDHFKALPPPRASNVRQVKVVRHGGSVAVSWQRAPFAKAYVVVTDSEGGAVRSLHLKPKHTGAKVKVPATEGGTVEVVAFGPTGDRGKPGKATFKALRAAKTRLLPYNELGTGAVNGTAKKKHKGKPKH